MIKTTTIVEESTPVFGDSQVANEAQPSSAPSWDEEKTLLVFEDEEHSATAKLSNTETGETFELDEFPYLIGRSKTANLQIKHRSVSREHAQITQQSGVPVFVIEDVASSNGIRVNGLKTKKVVLSDKDIVKFGDVEFDFEVEQDEDAQYSQSDRQTTTIIGEVMPLNSSSDSSGSSESKAASPSFSFPHIDFGRFKNFVSSKFAGGSGSTQSKYPLIAVVAIAVLALAYFLSPARRVDIIEAAPPQVADNVAVKDSAKSEEPEKSAAQQSGSSQDNSTNVVSVAAAESLTGEASDGSTEKNSETEGAEAAQKNGVAPVTSKPDGLQEVAAEVVVEIEDPAPQNSVTTKATAIAVQLDGRSVAAVDSDAKSASPPAASVAAATKVIRRSPNWSRAYIENSLVMYTKGDADNALKRLGILSRSSRHQRPFRQEAGLLAKSIDGIYKQYLSGRALFDQGGHDEAFTIWRDFLVNEANLLPGRESVYARNIKSEVVNLYTSQGNISYAEGQQHEAYIAWQKASTISPNGEAASSLTDLENRAKERFIDGYMQESVNLTTATSLWRDVVNMVPPANEYHIKAKAKLRLYKSYGSN